VDTGSYLIREFARQFVHVRAESAGAAVAITKEAKDVWRAAPAAAAITVIAQVYAYDLSVRTAYLDSTRVLQRAEPLLLPEGRDARRARSICCDPTATTSSSGGRDDTRARRRDAARIWPLQGCRLRRTHRPSGRDE
jgi:predicted metalloprotease with PDZ domain